MRPPKGRHCSVGRAVRRNTYSRRSIHRLGIAGASSITTSRAAVMALRASGLASMRDKMRSLLTSPTETRRREDTVCPPTSWAAEPAHARTTTDESPHSSRAARTSRVSKVLLPHPAAPTAATLRPPRTERATSTCDGSRRREVSAMVARQTGSRRRSPRGHSPPQQRRDKSVTSKHTLTAQHKTSEKARPRQARHRRPGAMHWSITAATPPLATKGKRPSTPCSAHIFAAK